MIEFFALSPGGVEFVEVCKFIFVVVLAHSCDGSLAGRYVALGGYRGWNVVTQGEVFIVDDGGEVLELC